MIFVLLGTHNPEVFRRVTAPVCIMRSRVLAATQEAFGRMIGAQGPAVENLKRLLAQVDAPAAA